MEKIKINKPEEFTNKPSIKVLLLSKFEINIFDYLSEVFGFVTTLTTAQRVENSCLVSSYDFPDANLQLLKRFHIEF